MKINFPTRPCSLICVLFGFRNVDHVGDIASFLMGRLGPKGYLGAKLSKNALVQTYYSRRGVTGSRTLRTLTERFSVLDSVLRIMVCTGMYNTEA